MKRLVLIEDAPWRAKENLLQLKNEGVEIEKIFFFTISESMPAEYKEAIKQLEEALETDIDKIGISDFYSTLDKYYDRENLFMLFDLNLDEESNFGERINVRYANSKRDKGKGKIWFYTTGGKDLKSMLVQNFTNQLIDVEGFYDNQLSWNDNQILQIAKEN